MTATKYLRNANDWAEKLPLLLQGPVFVGAFATIIGFSVSVVVSFGQIAGIGIRQAWSFYGRYWVLGPLAGTLVGIAFGGFMGGVLVAFSAIDKFKARHAGAAWTALKVAVFGVPIAFFAVSIFQGASSSARQRLAALNTSATKTAEDQRKSLNSASENAARLLLALDSTESQLQVAKQQLRGTLSILQQQQTAVDDSAAALRDLSNRQALLQEQLGAIQGALNGRQPISKQDLDSSQRWGLVEGAVLGIITSMAAAYLMKGLSSWRNTSSRSTGNPES